MASRNNSSGTRPGDDTTITRANITALHQAVVNNKLEDVINLVSLPGINVNDPLPGGETPLFLAVYNGYDSIVKHLVSLEATDVNRPNHTGYSPLLAAIGKNHDKVIEELLKSNKINVNQAGFLGITPITVAIQMGNVKVVEMLCSKPDIIITSVSPDYAPEINKVLLLHLISNFETIHGQNEELTKATNDVNSFTPEEMRMMVKLTFIIGGIEAMNNGRDPNAVMITMDTFKQAIDRTLAKRSQKKTGGGRRKKRGYYKTKSNKNSKRRKTLIRRR